VFFIGSALAGATGVVQGLYFGVTVFNIGPGGPEGVTAAVLASTSITGAAIGRFVIGFIEVLSSIFGWAAGARGRSRPSSSC
jgi:branched-chain amino acid transport system permease protein